jgi:NADH-quinone oxidoreductase subunit J
MAKEDLGSLRSVGRSLFTDYVYAVEIAGTVLLIATIGAICMAPRRSQGNL